MFHKYYRQFYVLCVFIPMVCGCSERSVIDSIFQNYNKLTRPVIEQNETVDVQFELRVYNIIAIDEPDELINLLLWTTSLWYDQFLTWNPADFGGCTTVKVSADQIWSPDVYFINTLQIQSISPSGVNFVSITSDGRVRLALKYNAQLGCVMAIGSFPFDTQHCPITVGLWTYNYTEVVLYLRYPVNGLTPMNNDPNFQPIMGNTSEFETVTYTALEVQSTVGHQSYSELHYEVGLRRRPEYYIYVLLIPTYLLTSLCIIGIFTPNSNINERNERVTLGLTTLLSMAVILNIVADQMPKGSQGLPLLGVFVLNEIGVCTFAIILSTVIIIAHQRSLTRGWKPPAICYWVARARTSKMDRGVSAITVKCGPSFNQERGTSDGNISSATDKALGRQYDVLQESCSLLRKTIERMECRAQKDEERECIESIWQTCFDKLDSFLLVFLLLFNTAVSFLILR